MPGALAGSAAAISRERRGGQRACRGSFAAARAIWKWKSNGDGLREDLYYRISGVCLRLPPLRQRKEDIPFLMGYFLRKYARDFRRTVPDLSAETLRLFLDYSWPGNLRELEDAARVLVALGDEHVALGGLRRSAAQAGGGQQRQREFR